jgi:hypothetical protein
VATLWRLEWNDERLLCAVYRGAGGLQLCVESPTGIIASERFALRPRAVRGCARCATRCCAAAGASLPRR